MRTKQAIYADMQALDAEQAAAFESFSERKRELRDELIALEKVQDARANFERAKRALEAAEAQVVAPAGVADTNLGSPE